MPDCAAHPACIRLVHAPSARYSMMPDAMLPAIPSADAIAVGGSRSAAATAPAATQRAEDGCGMKAGLVRRHGRNQTQAAQQLDPVAIPTSNAARQAFALARGEHRRDDHRAEWTGPPSKVSSKSSPCAAVPFTSAAPNASNDPDVTEHRARAAVHRAERRRHISRRAATHNPATSTSSLRAATPLAGEIIRRHGCEPLRDRDATITRWSLRCRRAGPDTQSDARSDRITPNRTQSRLKSILKKGPCGRRWRGRARAVVRFHHEPKHHAEHHGQERHAKSAHRISDHAEEQRHADVKQAGLDRDTRRRRRTRR